MTTKAAQLWHLCVNVFRSFRARIGMETAKSLTYTSLFAVVPDRKSTRLNSSHIPLSRMPSSA